MSGLRCSCVILLALVWVLPAFAFAQELPQIRVLLDEEQELQQVGGELSWSGDGLDLGSTSGAVSIGRSGETVVVRIGGQQRYAKRLSATPRSDYVAYDGRRFRGRLEFFSGKAGGCVVLNVLSLEDYLPGVVPREMPASWHTEALRAQAVAARTYAISRMAANRESTFDVVATEGDQVYRGVDGEDPRTNEAVSATRNQILTYDGFVIIAYFSSSAGGYTKDGGQPYLKPVPSPEDASPYNSWSFELSSAELNELAAAKGVSLGRLAGIDVRYAPISGHLEELVISGNGGAVSFTGPQLRRYVGRDVMRGTLALVEPLGSSIEATEAPAAFVANAPAGNSAWEYDTLTVESYMRPWVASAGMPEALKMRLLYAYDGASLMRCNHPMQAVSAASLVEQQVAAPVQLGPATAYSGALTGLRVTGSGYGHGRGLSQWGAKQMAETGADYRSILTHYYSGVELTLWNGSLAIAGEELSAEFYQPFSYAGG